VYQKFRKGVKTGVSNKSGENGERGYHKKNETDTPVAHCLNYSIYKSGGRCATKTRGTRPRASANQNL